MRTTKMLSAALAAVLFVIALPGLSQQVALSSLEEALQLALSTNIDFKNYELNQRKAEAEYKQYKNYRLPMINGTFSGQKNLDLATTPLPGEVFGQPGQTVEAQFGQEYTYNAGISISKELINREAALQAKISKLGIQFQEIEKDIFENLLKEQVSLYYYTGLVAKRSIAIGEQDLTSAKNIYKLTQQRYDEGVVDAITLNKAKINENSIKQNLNSNRQLEQQCLIELKKLFALGVSDTLALTGELQYSAPEFIELSQLSSDPTLQTAALQLEQADLQLKLSKSALLPSISLNSYFGRQQFRDDFGLGFSNGDWSNYSYLSLNLTVPIFNGFRNKSKIKQNNYNRQFFENEKFEREQNMLLEDQLLYSDYSRSIEDATASFESYQLYKENKDLTFQKYEEGLIGLDSYLTVFEDYLRAENNYLNALSKLYTYYSQIISRIG